jgi:hypothetical protein
LSDKHSAGRPRRAMRLSSSRTTRRPGSDVSATSAQDPDELLLREPARLHVHPLPGDGRYPFLEDFAGLRSERSLTGRTIIISRFLDLLKSINTSPGDPTGSAAVINLSALKELWKRGCGRTSAGRPQSRYQIPKAVLSNGNRFGTGPIDLFAWENVPAKSCDSFSRERGD